MSKRILLGATMLVAASSFSFAQMTISKTNALFGPVFKTAVATQEVKIAKNITTSTSIKTRPASDINLFGLGAVTVNNQSYTPFGSAKFSGVGNVTELRFYGKKKGAFHGFYFGTYFSYMHYKLNSASIREDFHDASGNVVAQADVNQVIKLNIGGGGVEIGTMGLYANNHLCIDWTIIGAGFGTIGLQGGLEASNPSISDFDWRNYPTDLSNTNMAGDKLFHKLKDQRVITATEATINGVKVPMMFLRTGLSFGFGYGANWKIGKKNKTGDGDAQPTMPNTPSGGGSNGQWR